MSGKLENKVAVITGTGDGIARTIALRFAAEGAKIVGCDINEETAAETVDLVRRAGGEMECLYPLDLLVEDNARRLGEFAIEKFGGVDILYNSAMSLRIGALEELPFEDWQHTIDNTLSIHFLASKHVVPHMRARGGGSVIFVGSASGTTATGYPGNLDFLLAYGCAKAALLRMSTILSVGLADSGIRVNAISPGCVETPAGLNFYGAPGTRARELAEKGLLIPRLGTTEDVANAAMFLASDDSSWVTGHNIAVDGGFAAGGGAGIATARDREILAGKMLELSEG